MPVKKSYIAKFDGTCWGAMISNRLPINLNTLSEFMNNKNGGGLDGTSVVSMKQSAFFKRWPNFGCPSCSK